MGKKRGVHRPLWGKRKKWTINCAGKLGKKKTLNGFKNISEC